jgi:CBS domain-containing protein
MKAKDIMTRQVISVYPETKIADAAKLLLEKHLNGLPVIDHDGNLVGIICQSDLIFQQKKIPVPTVFTFLDGLFPLTSYKDMEKEVKKIAAADVKDAMAPSPFTVKPDTSLEDIATIMVRHNVHTLPVVEENRVVGVIGKEDVLRTLMTEAS